MTGKITFGVDQASGPSETVWSKVWFDENGELQRVIVDPRDVYADLTAPKMQGGNPNIVIEPKTNTARPIPTPLYGSHSRSVLPTIEATRSADGTFRVKGV